MNNIIARIRKELLEVLPAFIFFVVMFHILMVTRALTLVMLPISQGGFKLETAFC